MLKVPDIYFLEKYGELYEELENGIVEVFKYESHLGTVRNMFIKREIPLKINNKTYYDITTPYGYGGPIVLECRNIEDRKDLVRKYEESFKEYCLDNDIVSEFIRFHPVLKNQSDFDEIYDVEYMRKTLGTNLEAYEDPFQEEFSNSCRKNIRRALRDGITFKVEENPKSIDEFLIIYNSTMDRNHANEYYYFGKKYFSNMINKFENNVILVSAIYDNKTIAAGLYFVFDEMIHIHLSGTLNEYLELSPAYILRYAVTLWGKENGYKLIHHGGGTSNSEEDSLLRFKKRFAKNTEFDFYIGKKIWNNEIYVKMSELTIKKDSGLNSDFFPIYRS